MPNSLKCKIKHLCHNGTITERERDRILKALEQEPCEDAVSRADTLQSFESYCENNCQYSKKQRNVMCGACMMGDAIEIVENLPSVTPKPKMGKWMKEFNDIEGEVRFTCSSCGEFQLFGTYFCPNCGAKMEGVRE